MPVAWTDEVRRTLFPIRLGIGRDVTLWQNRDGAVLSSRGPAPKEFPATAQGWIDLWTSLAATTKPEKLHYALVAVNSAKSNMRSTPFRNAEAALQAEAQGRLVLPGLVFLGGHAYGEVLRTGAVVDLRVSVDDVVLTSVRDASVVWCIAGRRLVEIEASGPGSTTTGAFVVATGHGLVGDLMEQA
jgi:hypothetical protein